MPYLGGVDMQMTSTPPLVSIIMAVKDTAPYLAECLESIIAQTYTNWELIAVNDHSSDNSLEILQEYAKKDKRIKVVENDGQKLIAALQTGYKHVSGSLINRMDSDDRMPDYKLELMVSEWQKVGEEHIIAGGTKHFVDEGDVGGGFQRYDQWLNDVAKKSSHYEELYQECTIPSHCWLIAKTDFDKVGGFNSPVYPEDYDLTFRFYKAGLKVIGLDQVLHYWRDRSDRISRTWDVYKDNRYFDLKMRYFYELDRDLTRPLVLWGAGRNGKDLAKLILEKEKDFNWVCDNESKIGNDIYGIIMQDCNNLSGYDKLQIIIAVASPDGKREIKAALDKLGKKAVKDFWFFC
jgi:glycosyltransferase involved in cell wall biosynthesis